MSTRSWLILATSFVVGIGFFVYLLGTAPNSPSSSDVGPADSQLIYAIEQNRPHASLAAAVEQDKLSSGTPLSQVSRLHVPFVPAKLVPPEGSAASALEGLWDSAEQGDAAANYSIFRILQECFAKLAWGFSSSSLDCAGVSEDNLARRIEFLERAAALGEPNAQVEYVAAAGSSFEQALDIAVSPSGRVLRQCQGDVSSSRSLRKRSANHARSSGCIRLRVCGAKVRCWRRPSCLGGGVAPIIDARAASAWGQSSIKHSQNVLRAIIGALHLRGRC
jgi:hypothetical protein